MPDKTSNYSLETTRLPNEIIAIIINQLPSDEERKLAALASCRLASHVLCSLATPLFFSSIHLKVNFLERADAIAIFQQRADKLDQILNIHDIAASVQTLRLKCFPENLENETNGNLVFEILHRLPRLQKFCLGMSANYLKFSSITGRVASAIQALCRSPHLTTLDLCNVKGFPIAAIIASPSLRCLHLQVTSLFFHNANSMDETTSLQHPCLESLEMDHPSVYKLAADIQFSGNVSFEKYFSHIKALQLNDIFCHRESMKQGWYMMLLASQSLTTIDLLEHWEPTIDFQFAFEVVPFDLGRLPSLRHFKIQMQNNFSNVDPFRLLNPLLSISSSTSIEILEIKITLRNVKHGHENDVLSSEAGWSELDKILTCDNFVCLKKITLSLVLTMAGMEDDSDDGYQKSLGIKRNLTLSCVNTLLPMFTASSSQRTLEACLVVV